MMFPENNTKFDVPLLYRMFSNIVRQCSDGGEIDCHIGENHEIYLETSLNVDFYTFMM